SKDLSPAYSDKPDPTDRIMANLEDETYSSYIKRIQERFETIGEYPEEAAFSRNNGPGSCDLRILADGTLDGVTLSRSSGSAILDEEALRIVRVASPYIPLPTAFHKKELH
ncbi:TonB family protein, partial [mine drainage metagenome]